MGDIKTQAFLPPVKLTVIIRLKEEGYYLDNHRNIKRGLAPADWSKYQDADGETE